MTHFRTKPAAKNQRAVDGTVEPWSQRTGEPAKAYSAFLSYLELGPDKRSLQAAYRQRYGNDTAAPGWFLAWSGKFSWVARAKSWDEAELAKRMALLERAKRQGQERIAASVPRVADLLIKIGLGEVEADSHQVTALRDVLDRAGIAAIRRVETSGPSGGPIQTQGRIAVEPYRLRKSEMQALLAVGVDFDFLESVIAQGADDDEDADPALDPEATA